jgi:uncharacterized protein with HEPN domain
MREPDEIRIRHMIEAAESAAVFIQGKSRADLEHQQMLLFALVRAIEIVGEAAGNLSEEARLEMPEVPWPAIVGMRNRLAHAYFDINHDILWNTVTQALPVLVLQLKTQLRN